MISFDTNLLLYSLNRDCAEYNDCRAFFASLPTTPGAVAICELVLTELYVLLRNPAVLKNPLEPAEAAFIIQTFRQHPTWALKVSLFPSSFPALGVKVIPAFQWFTHSALSKRGGAALFADSHRPD